MKFKLVESINDRLVEEFNYDVFKSFSNQLFEWLGIAHQEGHGEAMLREVGLSLIDQNLDPDAYCVHHIDKDRTNNHYTNIAFMPIYIHDNFHKVLRKLINIDGNPFQEAFETYLTSNINKLIAAADTKEAFSEVARYLLKQFPNVYILHEHVTQKF
jgi:hypothetical protein